MKCATHHTKEAITTCSQCRTPLCDICIHTKTESTAMCSRCSALSAVSDFVSHEKVREETYVKQEEKSVKKTKRKTKIQYVIIAIALVIVTVQISKLTGTSSYIKDLEPSEQFVHLCLDNFWKFSKILKEGEALGEDVFCPLSNQPYIIENNNGNIVIRDPAPESHGFAEMWISSDWPEPVLRESVGRK
jgi:hypothetical protein